MARTSEDRSNFLRILAEKPFLYYACKKAGISRATIYRWMKSNPAFGREVHKVRSEGLANQNDAVEMVLVKKALEGDTGAIKFYLPHNMKKYRPKRAELPPPPISSREREMYAIIYEWAIRNQPVPPETREQIMHAFKTMGLMDKNGNYTEEFRTKFSSLLRHSGENKKSKKKSGLPHGPSLT